jgi:hypothetical protein
MIVNQAYSMSSPALTALGVGDYTLIMYCPSLSILYGPGAAGNLGTTTKIGGLTITATGDLNNDAAAYPNFYTVNKGAYSMASIYGSQGDTISDGAFVWASRLDVHLLGAGANASGTARLGHFTLSSLYERDAVSSITTNDLLRAVHTTIDLKSTPRFYL